MSGTTKTQRHQEKLPDGWRWVKLGDVCELNPRRPLVERQDDTPTTFVPMEAVDAVSGTITDVRVRLFGEIKKGYTYFAEGDVLFAKITPCMQNGKHTIAQGLIDGIGFGTTEFHVLRPGADITPKWVHFFVRQPTLLIKATEHFTGAVGQQRLPSEYLANLGIPLPPLAEQRRIAAILTEQMAAVDTARAAAEARLKAVKALPAAFLRQVFPQPGAPLPAGWQWIKLGEVLKLKSGEFLPASSMKTGGLFPVYGGNGITGWHDSYMFEESKIIIGRVGALCGCIHITQPQSWITDNALYVSIQLVSFDDDFMSRYLTFLNLNKLANQMGQPVIASGAIYEQVIALPPLAEQRRIATTLHEQMADVDKARTAAEAELEAINAMPAALLRRAFRGKI